MNAPRIVVALPSLLLAGPATLLMLLASPARTATEPDMPVACRAAESAARAVVLVQYVLEKEGRGFGGIGQRADLAAVGTIVTEGGLVVLPGAIFPESEDEQRLPARPRDFVVRLGGGREVKADLLGRDREVGLAFLQLAGEAGTKWPHVDLVSAAPRPGDPVLLVELLPEKYGFAPTLRRTMVGAVLEHPRALYDLDARLDDGAIGAPVIDSAGRVIGIVTTDRIGESPGALQQPLRVLGVLSRQKEAGFPMVVPAATIAGLARNPPRDAVLAPREKSWLGVTLQPVPRSLAEHLGIPSPTGVMITGVRGGSPAEAAGLLLHDVIRGLDGVPVEATNEDLLPRFIETVQALGAGRTIRLDVWRDGADRDVAVTLGTAPPTSVVAEEYRNEALGVVTQDLTLDILMARDLPEDLEGVIVSELETAGQAQVAGLGRGDIIQGVNRRAVRNVRDLETTLVEAQGQQAAELVFFVLRDADTLFIPVKPTW